jgi:hypothetical protein
MNAHKNSTLPEEAMCFKIRRILHAQQTVRNLCFGKGPDHSQFTIHYSPFTTLFLAQFLKKWVLNWFGQLAQAGYGR